MITYTNGQLVSQLGKLAFDIASFSNVDVMEVAKDLKMAITYTKGIQERLGKYSPKVLTDEEIVKLWKEIAVQLDDKLFVAALAVRIRLEIIKVQLGSVVGNYDRTFDWSTANAKEVFEKGDEVVEYFRQYIK